MHEVSLKANLLKQIPIRNNTPEQSVFAPPQQTAERSSGKQGMPVLALAASAPLALRSQGQSNRDRFERLHIISDDLQEPALPTRKPYSVNTKKPAMPTPRRRSETRRRSATDPNSSMEFDGLPKVENKNDREDSVTGSISPYVTVPVGDPLPLSKSSATLSRQDFLRRNPAGTVR